VLILECLVSVLQTTITTKAHADLTTLHTASQRARNEVITAMDHFAQRLLTVNGQLRAIPDPTMIARSGNPVRPHIPLKWIPTDDPKSSPCSYPVIVKSYRARYPFKAKRPEELDIERGQVVEILNRSSSGDDWWTGRIGNREGILQGTSVTQFSGLSLRGRIQTHQPSTNTNLRFTTLGKYVVISYDSFSFLDGLALGAVYCALWTFKSQDPDDLTFQRGQVVEILKKTEFSSDWWYGRVGKKEGLFPGKEGPPLLVSLLTCVRKVNTWLSAGYKRHGS